MVDGQQIPDGKPPTEDPVSSMGMIVAMGAIGTLSAVLLVVTYVATLPAIERNRAEVLERAIFAVLPGASSKTTFAALEGVMQAVSADNKSRPRYYAGYDQAGELVGVAVEAKGPGFQDTLKILYGYSPACACIVGLKVLESKETPGLVDKIETDPAFIANFQALDVSRDAAGAAANPLVLVKPGKKTKAWQVEGITGATISSRAITRILRANTAQPITIIEDNLEVFKRGRIEPPVEPAQ